MIGKNLDTFLHINTICQLVLKGEIVNIKWFIDSCRLHSANTPGCRFMGHIILL